jgi:hypothetical protein
MSEVHVYGVVPASAPALETNGVRLIAHRDVAALVSDLEDEGPRAVSLLRAHWRILEEAASHTTVLPVRFGTVMADDSAVVEEFLEPSYDELAASLTDMTGKVQLTLKGFYEQDALMSSIVGRSPAIARLRDQVRSLPEAAAYYKRIELGQLVAAEVERARDRDAQEIVGRLQPLALETRLEAPTTAEGAVNAAFLVDTQQVDEFNRAVATLGRELAGRIRLRYVGPLPPYSFTGEAAEAWG